MDYLASLVEAFNPHAEAPEEFDPEQFSAEEDGELVPIPAFYQPLFQACHAVAAGQIEVDAWWTAWEAVADQFESTATAVAEQIEAAQEPVPLAEELLQALEQAQQALADMATYPEQGDPEILNQGWLALVRATALNQAVSARLQQA